MQGVPGSGKNRGLGFHCKKVGTFAKVKNARAVKRKVWRENGNGEGDWGKTFLGAMFNDEKLFCTKIVTNFICLFFVTFAAYAQPQTGNYSIGLVL